LKHIDIIDSLTIPAI